MRAAAAAAAAGLMKSNGFTMPRVAEAHVIVKDPRRSCAIERAARKNSHSQKSRDSQLAMDGFYQRWISSAR